MRERTRKCGDGLDFCSEVYQLNEVSRFIVPFEVNEEGKKKGQCRLHFREALKV